jgi:cell wall-associated NlpC family hydrolase
MDGTIVGILFNMSGVNLLELSEDGQWYHIVSNGIEGYINAGYVATGEEARTLAYDNCFAAVTVNAEVLNVRQEPTTESAILTQIRAGSLYEVSEETNDEWLKVVISGEIEGYVSREFVTYDYALQDAVAYTEPEAEPEPEEVEEEVPAINPVRLDLVNNAMQYLGGAYVWGGTTLGKGVDCSGFVLRIFEQYGYSLPRTSYWQVNSGIAVSFEEMQPGDLIFYWNNSLGRIGHVAIYIGNNLIIHAASAQRGIVIDDYRFMTPYCARNIIGE